MNWYKKSQKTNSNLFDIQSPEFKQWFGNSHVVDSQGKPLVTYRGSISGEEKEFKTRYHYGLWFTPDKNYASGYGDTSAAYLSVQNPYFLNNEIRKLLMKADSKRLVSIQESLKSYAKEHGHDGIYYPDDGQGGSWVVFSKDQVRKIS